MSQTLAKLLVVRNDRLGDFMLAYPTFLLLKQSLPQASIHALVPAYTREMAESCDGIDQAIIDPGPRAGRSEQRRLLRRLREERYDAIVTLYSTTRVGLLGLLARIPYRLAPATKFAQVFYNRRMKQRRSQSMKPEHEYNLDLGFRLLSDFGVAPCTPVRPYLRFPGADRRALRAAFCETRGIPQGHRLVFVHPGSGGSASNLSVEQFAALARSLRAEHPFTIVISAGPAERDAAERMRHLLDGIFCTIYYSTEGLRRFAQHIQLADLFISGSTGPLHIAGALDRPTAAFYTRRRSATSLRWQTLNSPDRRLAFSPPEDAAEEDMSRIDIPAAARVISERFLSSDQRGEG